MGVFAPTITWEIWGFYMTSSELCGQIITSSRYRLNFQCYGPIVFYFDFIFTCVETYSNAALNKVYCKPDRKHIEGCKFVERLIKSRL